MNRPIRIAHVVFRLDYGGLENGVVNLIRRLPAGEFEHAVVSLTQSTEFRCRLPDHVAVVDLHKRPGNDPACLWRAWRMLRSGRFDILHTRNLPCIETQFAGLLAGVPVRIHGEHGWDVFDLEGKRRRYRWLRRASSLAVSRYVVLSCELERYLVRDVGIDSARITRICNGVDTDTFRPAEAGLPTDPFVVGAVGRLEEVKDFMTLARAFSLAARGAGRPIGLTVVGDGSQRAALEAFIAEEGLASRCAFVGACDDVPRLMRTFGVFVLSSLAEGISNTILEAMASGLPVIATDVGGNGELVVEGETGFLVPPGDAAAMAERLGYYRDNPMVAASHGRAGRERALRHFSIDEMVRRYGNLYRECVYAAGLREAAA